MSTQVFPEIIRVQDLVEAQGSSFSIRRNHLGFSGVELNGNPDPTVRNQLDAAREAYAALLVAKRCSRVWVGKAAQEFLYPGGKLPGDKDCDVVGQIGNEKKYILAEAKGVNEIGKALTEQLHEASAQISMHHGCVESSYVVAKIPRLIRFGFPNESDKTGARRMCWLKNDGTRHEDVSEGNAAIKSPKYQLDPPYIYISTMNTNDEIGMPVWSFSASNERKIIHRQHKNGERYQPDRYYIGGGLVEIVFVDH